MECHQRGLAISDVKWKVCPLFVVKLYEFLYAIKVHKLTFKRSEEPLEFSIGLWVVWPCGYQHDVVGKVPPQTRWMLIAFLDLQDFLLQSTCRCQSIWAGVGCTMIWPDVTQCTFSDVVSYNTPNLATPERIIQKYYQVEPFQVWILYHVPIRMSYRVEVPALIPYPFAIPWLCRGRLTTFSDFMIMLLYTSRKLLSWLVSDAGCKADYACRHPVVALKHYLATSQVIVFIGCLPCTGQEILRVLWNLTHIFLTWRKMAPSLTYLWWPLAFLSLPYLMVFSVNLSFFLFFTLLDRYSAE